MLISTTVNALIWFRFYVFIHHQHFSLNLNMNFNCDLHELHWCRNLEWLLQLCATSDHRKVTRTLRCNSKIFVCLYKDLSFAENFLTHTLHRGLEGSFGYLIKARWHLMRTMLLDAQICKEYKFFPFFNIAIYRFFK